MRARVVGLDARASACSASSGSARRAPRPARPPRRLLRPRPRRVRVGLHASARPRAGSDLGDARLGRSSPLGSAFASAWCAGTPQYVRAGQRRVRAALAVREDRGAAARVVLVVGVAAAEGRLGLGLRRTRCSDWMSIFQPVSRVASRAFMPSLPIASASWSSGTTTVASLRLVVEVDLAHARRRERLRDEARRLRCSTG